jgi:hypothetical protein
MVGFCERTNEPLRLAQAEDFCDIRGNIIFLQMIIPQKIIDIFCS